jgi:hypothetical protein
MPLSAVEEWCSPCPDAVVVLAKLELLLRRRYAAVDATPTGIW